MQAPLSFLSFLDSSPSTTPLYITFFRQVSACHISCIKCSWVKSALVFVSLFLRLSVFTHTDVCVCMFVRSRLERHLRALHPDEHSPHVRIKDVSCFPTISLVSLAPSWGYHTGGLCREGSLAPASKHTHMPPLTPSVPSNLHAIMTFFMIWHSKIYFLDVWGSMVGV